MAPSLTIIGCGNVGKALGRLWHAEGLVALNQILNRSPESGRRAASFVGAGDVITQYSELHAADIFMIAVPDDQIEKCARELAATGLLQRQSILFHCSGSLPSTAMHDAAASGAALASAHPIRSFASPEQVIASFAGTWCGMEGDERALAMLDALFSAIGANTVRIDASAKMLYHSAAVFASNYLVTLGDIALDAYAQAGIPRETGLRMIAPLMRKTVDNLLVLGPERALSGPVARGDWQTVERQYRALEAWNPECAELYRQLAERSARLVQRRTPDAD